MKLVQTGNQRGSEHSKWAWCTITNSITAWNKAYETRDVNGTGTPPHCATLRGSGPDVPDSLGAGRMWCHCCEVSPCSLSNRTVTVWGTRSLYLQGHMTSWPASDNEELSDRSYSVSQSVARFTTETLWAGLVLWTGHPTYVFGLWEETQTGKTWSSNRCTAKPPQPNYAF